MRRTVIDTSLRSSFYREWSSRAAREALESDQAMTKDRCASSAAVWGSLADAIESGDGARIALLTHNLTLMPIRYHAPSC